MDMRILILGASGYTGSFLKNFFADKANEVYGTYRTQRDAYQNDSSMFHFDMEQVDEIYEILAKTKPNVIISCLRGDFNKQMEVHKIVISYFRKMMYGKFVFLSTSNVFDNDLTVVHTENDITNAHSDYGKYKAECEKIILDSLGDQAIVLRTSFILGKNCRRSRQVLEYARKKILIPSYENIYFNYTPVIQIAEWLWYILKNNLSGIFHVGTKDVCVYTEFVQQLLQSLKISGPEYSVECVKEKSYQAVIPARREIPDEMQIVIKDVIAYLQNEYSESLYI